MRAERNEEQGASLTQPSSPRKSSDSSSPEFEFWKIRNVSSPEPHLLSADELFVDGVILPLSLLRANSEPETHLRSQPEPEREAKAEPESEPAAPAACTADPGPSTSKRWTDIFKIGDRKSEEVKAREKEKKKKKERRPAGAGSAGPTDLNINLWPFARSRSAGNSAASRPKVRPSRKTSSAPCSRSNSAGESKSRKWPASPARVALSGGIHLGRSSPVWQVRRGAGVSEPAAARGGPRRGPDTSGNNSNNHQVSNSRIRVLNLNVPMCIGYRHHISCRSDNDGTAVGNTGGKFSVGGGGGNGSGNGSSGAPFSLRSLFSKKSVLIN